MKKTKIISGLMAMAMTVMSLGISASAADSVAVKIGTDTVESAGGAFSVDVELGSVPSSGLSSIDFAINYDSSVLKISDVKLGTIGDTGAKSKEGDLGDTVFNWYDNGKQIVIIWATGLTDSQYWVKSSGTFITLTGTVKDGVAAGTVSKLEGAGADRNIYPDSSTKASAYLSAVGESGTTDYTAAFTAGSVAVEEKKVDTTTEPKSDEADWGNVNCRDGVDVADAVLLARLCAQDSGAVVSAQGKINADVTHDGTIDGSDTLKILKYIAKIISADDLAKK